MRRTIPSVLVYLIASAAVLSACASRPDTASRSRDIASRGAAPAHCLYACPRSAPRGNEFIERTLYTLSNNGETKFADWVAYIVWSDLAGSDGSRNWAPDPDLDETTTLEEEDYAQASARYNWDMGHQAPLASFAGAEAWRETNFLSNITPQNGQLNRGRWARLEAAERDLSAAIEGPVYVITGPLYDNSMPELPNADETHVVPSGYWKIIAIPGRASGFIFENAPDEGSYCDYEVERLSEIERRSGLDLFPGVSLRSLRPLTTDLGC